MFSSHQRIPKIIHQTWKNTEVPEKWKKSPEMWKRYHPDWEYRLWTDEDNRRFIEERFPEYLALYDSYKYPIQRADMIRYFILYVYGGVYSDLDLYPTESIEPYLQKSSDVVLVLSGNTDCITNSFMASVPGTPFWTEVHRQLKEPLPSYAIGKHLTVMCSTGPIMLDEVAKKSDSLITLLPRKRFMAYSVGDDYSQLKSEAVLHPLEGQSWNSWDSRFLNVVNNNRILFCILGLILILYLIAMLIYYILKSRCCQRVCSIFK